MTKRTITTQAKLEKELARVREQGYAMEDGEITEGLRCVAVPIWDGTGSVRYAVSVSGQIPNMGGERLERIIRELQQAAEEISYAMGSRRKRMQT